MLKTTLICDGCQTASAVKPYRINRGKEMDPSGNGYNTNWDYKDYCPKCHRALVNNDFDIEIYER